ncbi:unnamed protein product [Sphenostylis stenocarpa]|uniref:PGG domain-containing protein n=1 Tax=Sphenostylis stenocarpa TaxID=92480 RepID=A0AA86W4P6_9FABA|nr:unnamed protein product [Sphenostylis stenocarpa]
MEAAAREGRIASLYRMIEVNPRVLEDIDSIPFVETPLHVAARLGHVEFGIEIMTLKPSFAWKLNPQGLRPIHLALQRDHTTMVLRLIDMDKELVRAKMREGLTLLHMASQSGEIDLLTKFLKACPDSVKDLTVRSETALHSAVRNNQMEALKFLIRWLQTNTVEMEPILNQKDEEGNTILHIAASNNDTEAMKLLMKVRRMDVDAKNLQGQRALDITDNAEMKKKLGRAEESARKIKTLRSLILSMNEGLIRKTGMRQNMSKEMRSAYLVVATLVATATYHAALSPPGGLHQIDAAGTNNTLIHGHVASNSSKIYEGKSVMSNENFVAFSTMNMCAFVLSTLTIIGLLPKNVAWLLLYASTWLLIINFYFSMTVTSPTDLTTNLVACIFCVFVLFFAVVPIPFFVTGNEIVDEGYHGGRS